jgi:hypothetical protein
VNFAAPVTGSPFQYIDRTPSLVAGDVYYRVRAFGGNPANDGYSLLSDAIRANVLAPTTTGPAASHKMVSDKLWPQFRIAASNQGLLDKDASDFFFFTLFIKHADNSYPFLLVPFVVDFTETDTIHGAGEDVNRHRYGFPQGRPTAAFKHVDSWDQSGAYGDWYYATDYDQASGAYTPFVYLDDDGSVVIDTDSGDFRQTMDNAVRGTWLNEGEAFLPGAAYLWNLFGANGGVYWNSRGFPLYWSELSTNAAYFAKGLNAGAPVYLGCSYGSHHDYGHGSPEGWFNLIIAVDAK